MISLKQLQNVAVIIASFTTTICLVIEVILPLFYKQKIMRLYIFNMIFVFSHE